MIYNARLHASDLVATIVDKGVPAEWNIETLALSPDFLDKTVWFSDNVSKDFSASVAWESIRYHLPNVQWASSIGLQNSSTAWDDILASLITSARSKSFDAVISRIGVAAVAYYVWQERNNRLFHNQTRPPDILAGVILETIRLRLLSLTCKKTAFVEARLVDWGILDDTVFDNGG
ncbi:hypothetical protein SSX86_030059 [Deinandra increscens subsp. villosa]|uniref:Reverse transcriptase zinc-binding domain-containing protein n=1 Tax=Deinandra increscens subsp. villosa TaxID=3103831 RepID=A0AAP0CBP2_9ASTR